MGGYSWPHKINIVRKIISPKTVMSWELLLRSKIGIDM